MIVLTSEFEALEAVRDAAAELVKASADDFNQALQKLETALEREANK